MDLDIIPGSITGLHGAPTSIELMDEVVGGDAAPTSGEGWGASGPPRHAPQPLLATPQKAPGAGMRHTSAGFGAGSAASPAVRGGGLGPGPSASASKRAHHRDTGDASSDLAREFEDAVRNVPIGALSPYISRWTIKTRCVCGCVGAWVGGGGAKGAINSCVLTCTRQSAH
jgi:hypothetical protein